MGVVKYYNYTFNTVITAYTISQELDFNIITEI